jgi:hypothetical protein
MQTKEKIIMKTNFSHKMNLVMGMTLLACFLAASIIPISSSQAADAQTLVASVTLKYTDGRWSIAKEPVILPCAGPRLSAKAGENTSQITVQGQRTVTYYLSNPRQVSLESSRYCGKNEQPCTPTVALDENGLLKTKAFSISVPVTADVQKIIFMENPRTQLGITIDLKAAQEKFAKAPAQAYSCQPPDFRCPNGKDKKDCYNQEINN